MVLTLKPEGMNMDRTKEQAAALDEFERAQENLYEAQLAGPCKDERHILALEAIVRQKRRQCTEVGLAV